MSSDDDSFVEPVERPAANPTDLLKRRWALAPIPKPNEDLARALFHNKNKVLTGPERFSQARLHGRPSGDNSPIFRFTSVARSPGPTASGSDNGAFRMIENRRQRASPLVSTMKKRAADAPEVSSPFTPRQAPADNDENDDQEISLKSPMNKSGNSSRPNAQRNAGPNTSTPFSSHKKIASSKSNVTSDVDDYDDVFETGADLPKAGHGKKSMKLVLDSRVSSPPVNKNLVEKKAKPSVPLKPTGRPKPILVEFDDLNVSSPFIKKPKSRVAKPSTTTSIPTVHPKPKSKPVKRLDNNKKPKSPVVARASESPEPGPSSSKVASPVKPKPIFKMPAPVKPKPAKPAAKPKPSGKKRADPTGAPAIEAPSTSSTSANLDSDEYVEQLYDPKRSRYLTNWVPAIRKKRLVVEGDLLDFEAEDPKHFKNPWSSTSIHKRIRPNLVQTSKGVTYVLEGRMHPVKALRKQLPSFIKATFKNGFPENWEAYKDQWKVYLKDQAMAMETMSMYSMGSSMASYIGERSGFLVDMTSAGDATGLPNASRRSTFNPMQILDKPSVEEYVKFVNLTATLVNRKNTLEKSLSNARIEDSVNETKDTSVEEPSPAVATKGKGKGKKSANNFTKATTPIASPPKKTSNVKRVQIASEGEVIETTPPPAPLRRSPRAATTKNATTTTKRKALPERAKPAKISKKSKAEQELDSEPEEAIDTPPSPPKKSSKVTTKKAKTTSARKKATPTKAPTKTSKKGKVPAKAEEENGASPPPPPPPRRRSPKAPAKKTTATTKKASPKTTTKAAAKTTKKGKSDSKTKEDSDTPPPRPKGRPPKAATKKTATTTKKKASPKQSRAAAKTSKKSKVVAEIDEDSDIDKPPKKSPKLDKNAKKTTKIAKEPAATKKPAATKTASKRPGKKSAKALQKNSEALAALNLSHEDDIMRDIQAKKQVRKSTTAEDILGELFDSDSDNNISFNSARTPIGNYVYKSKIGDDEDDSDTDFE